MNQHSAAANALTLPAFRYYLAGTAVTYIGTWMERIALGWLAWELTASTFWTGLVTIAGLAPSGLIAPIAAAYAERWNMRRATIVLNLVLAALSMVIYILVVTGAARIEAIAMLSVCLGIVAACYLPVRLVLVTIVVPRTHLSSAVSNTAIAFNISRILGPMLAGVLIVNVGVGPTILLNALSYLPMIAVVALIPTRERKAAADPGSVLARMLDGARRALSSRLIMTCLAVSAVNGVIVRAIVENLPMIVGGLIDGTSTQLSAVAAIAGVGSILGAWLTGLQRGNAATIVHICLISLPCASLLLVLVAFQPLFPVLAACVLLLGVNATMTGIGTQTVIQLAVEDGFRARIVTWWSATNFAALSLGGMALSAIGEVIPLETGIAWLGGGGLVLALIVAAFAHRHKIHD